MIIVNKGYNINDSEQFLTNKNEYSLYTTMNHIPNPAVYENINEDEPAVRIQQEFFTQFPEIAEVLKTYFEWSVDLNNYYEIDPSNMVVKMDDGTEQRLTLFDCFHLYTIIIKPKEGLLDELYEKYDVPGDLKVSWAYNKEIPAYGYKTLVQWMCNPLNIPVVRNRLTEDETSFYRVFGGGLKS